MSKPSQSAINFYLWALSSAKDGVWYPKGKALTRDQVKTVKEVIDIIQNNDVIGVELDKDEIKFKIVDLA